MSVFKGRLGLEGARIAHGDRHGLMWLTRGRLFTDNGCLSFVTRGGGDLEKGVYQIPFQMVSCILLGPGSTISQDALRLLARHNTGLIVTGDSGVRSYASMPYGPDHTVIARRHAVAWADPAKRVDIARKLYQLRMGGELPPQRDLNALRGIEGARMKSSYKLLADQYGIAWRSRSYDRANPEAADLANQALNHAATACEAAAMIAVSAVGAIPQLGFLHEDSGLSFCLDIADVYRVEMTIPLAFAAVKKVEKTKQPVEREVRINAGKRFRSEQLIPKMIDTIKGLFDADDLRSDT